MNHTDFWNFIIPNLVMLIGQDRNSMTLFTPRNPIQVTEELCRWFGGRVPDNHMINTSTISFIHNELGGGDALSDSFTAMTRLDKSQLLNIVSCYEVLGFGEECLYALISLPPLKPIDPAIVYARSEEFYQFPCCHTTV